MYLAFDKFHVCIYIVQLLLQLLHIIQVTLFRDYYFLFKSSYLIMHSFSICYCIPEINLVLFPFQLKFHPLFVCGPLYLVHLTINPRDDFLQVPDNHIIVVDFRVGLLPLLLDLLQFLLHLDSVLVRPLERHLE
jgi:hypothetical protein